MSAQHTFKVGDKVKLNKVSKDGGGYNHPRPFKFATVVTVEPSTYTGAMPIKVREECPEGSDRTAWLHHTDIKHQKHQKTFKVGDKVKIVGAEISGSVTFPIGTIGTVERGPDGDEDYKITALDDYWFYRPSSLKRVKEKVQPLGEYTYWPSACSQTISAWPKEERTGALSRTRTGARTVEHKDPSGGVIARRGYAEDEVIDNGDGTGTVRTLKQLAKFRAKRAK